MRLQLVLSESDAVRLEELSERLQVSKSNVVRELIFHQHQIFEIAKR